MKKEPGLFSVQKGIILSSYVGIIINHYKDPKKINQDSMKCVLFFFFRGSGRDLDVQPDEKPGDPIVFRVQELLRRSRKDEFLQNLQPGF